MKNGILTAIVVFLTGSAAFAGPIPNDTTNALRGTLLHFRNEVNLRAWRNFDKDFGVGDEATWYKKKGCWWAYAAQDGKLIRVKFGPQGSWISTVLAYPESGLPASVRKDIKTVFPSCRVLWVNEQRDWKQTIYFMTLVSGMELRHISLTDEGEVAVAQKLTLEIPIPEN